jgi:hypothetical protein
MKETGRFERKGGRRRRCAIERGAAPQYIHAWNVEINWARIDPWLREVLGRQVW